MPLNPPIPVMPCLDKLNDWLMRDGGNAWTEEELEEAIYPPEPSRLDVQAMTALKPEPIPKPTVNQLHAKLNNGRNNLFFVVFEGE